MFDTYLVSPLQALAFLSLISFLAFLIGYEFGHRNGFDTGFADGYSVATRFASAELKRLVTNARLAMNALYELRQCSSDCGCAGGQPAATCQFLPSCERCANKLPQFTPESD